MSPHLGEKTKEHPRSPPSRVPIADPIKGLRSGSARRLRDARRAMPTPHGFREAAIATRALIRERRKSGEDDGDLLVYLYFLAAHHDFLLRTPYVEGIGPGINVAEKIPARVLRELDFPYWEVGFDELALLNKTDKRWLVARWGEPRELEEVLYRLWSARVETAPP